MTKVYLIHGFIGAGKSTYARKLAQETGAVLLSVDAWMAHFYGYGKEGFWNNEEFKVMSMQWQMAEILVQRGIPVILDWGFFERNQRDEARARVQRMGGEPVLVALEAPDDDVALARVLKRTEAQEAESIYVDESIFLNEKKNFEPLQDDEVALRILG